MLLPVTVRECEFKGGASTCRRSWPLNSPTCRRRATPIRVTMLEEEKIAAYYGAGTLYATPERAEPLL